MSLELVSYEALKDLLGLESDNISEYPGLKILKDSVEAAIECEAGREFESLERTETWQIGRCYSRRVYLYGIPIASVSSVTVGGTALTSDDYTITAGGLRLEEDFNEVDVVVTYTGGYSQTTLPAKIERAALLQTSYEFQNKEHIGASSITTEGGSVSIPALKLLPVVQKLISRFKHPWAGVLGI